MEPIPNNPNNGSGQDPAWERRTLEKLAFGALDEQRRRRRWGIFFKLLGFAYIGVALWAFMGWTSQNSSHEGGGKHTALVNLQGVINDHGAASAENINAALKAAFEDKNTAGIVLRINSPGGSPVQSGIINDEIKRLRAKYPDIPLNVVVEDVCASGGYYVAAAADKIFVNKASIVGSIGVLMDGFGFTNTMDKLGVERRLLTAGENKGFLDPFSPQQPTHREHAQVLLADIHQQFIDVVKQGRGSRLKNDPQLFSGLMWNGTKSIDLGLADGYGTVDTVAREIFKAETVMDFTVKENFAERFAKRLGSEMGESATRTFGRFSMR